MHRQRKARKWPLRKHRISVVTAWTLQSGWHTNIDLSSGACGVDWSVSSMPFKHCSQTVCIMRRIQYVYYIAERLWGGKTVGDISSVKTTLCRTAYIYYKLLYFFGLVWVNEVLKNVCNKFHFFATNCLFKKESGDSFVPLSLDGFNEKWCVATSSIERTDARRTKRHGGGHTQKICAYFLPMHRSPMATASFCFFTCIHKEECCRLPVT